MTFDEWWEKEGWIYADAKELCAEVWCVAQQAMQPVEIPAGQIFATPFDVEIEQLKSKLIGDKSVDVNFKEWATRQLDSLEKHRRTWIKRNTK